MTIEKGQDRTLTKNKMKKKTNTNDKQPEH